MERDGKTAATTTTMPIVLRPILVSDTMEERNSTLLVMMTCGCTLTVPLTSIATNFFDCKKIS